MTNMLSLLGESARKFQADIARVQGKTSTISDHDLELLTRQSQRLAIRCRELWAACYDERHNSSGGLVSAHEGAVYLPEWSVAAHADEAVEITLPLLLPKRTCPDAAFITEPLELLLSAHQADLPRFRRCYVLFRHIYGPGLSVRDIRDHDNIESRKVLNTIERHLLTSDSGYYCTNIHQTAQGAYTKTIILLAGSPNHLERMLWDEAAYRLADR